MSTTFRLVLTGKLLPGVASDQAITALAKLMRLELEHAEKLLNTAPTIIKKALPHQQLDTYLHLFQQAGVEVKAEALKPPAVESPQASQGVLALEPMAPAANAAVDDLGVAEVAQITCPQCGREQPKRTLCLGCGADMPRILAAQASAALQPNIVGTGSGPITAKAPSPASPRSRNIPEYETPPFWSFSIEGRLGRIRYLSNSVLAFMPMFAVLFLALATGNGDVNPLSMTLFLGAIAWAIIQNYRMLVFRLHDLNKPTKYAGWIILGQIVLNGISRSSDSASLIITGSLVSIIINGVLAFAKGDDEENDYGLPADPPNIFHYIAGCLCSIALVGMIIKTATMESTKPVQATANHAAQMLSDSELDELIAQIEQQTGQKMSREEARARIQEHFDKQNASSNAE